MDTTTIQLSKETRDKIKIMAKKVVAALGKGGGKDFTKVIKMVKQRRNGAYQFKEEIVHKSKTNDFFAKK